MQRRNTIVLALAATMALAAAGPAMAQARQTSSDDTFTWTGRMGAGSVLRVRNLAGDISVERARGGEVEIRAEKEWSQGDPGDVHFELLRDGGNVTVCAIWYEGSCDSNGSQTSGRSGRNRSTDVSVRFTILLPAGVTLDASGVSSGVTVTGATAGVTASSVSGKVVITGSSGPINVSSVSGRVEVDADRVGAVKASSVSGNVNVTIGSLLGREALSFNSVSGSVHVTLPADLAANVSVSSVSGRVQTDFPVQISGDRQRTNSLSGTIGGGGRSLNVSTVSGNVTLSRN